MEEGKIHSVSMKNRECLTITAVDDVESFDEEKVVVYTSMGVMTVLGVDFKISKLNVDDGQLVIEGMVDEIKYSQGAERSSHGGFFSSLFR